MKVKVDVARSIAGSVPVWDETLHSFVHYSRQEFERMRAKYDLMEPGVDKKASGPQAAQGVSDV
jgi:hypothetical protein